MVTLVSDCTVPCRYMVHPGMRTRVPSFGQTFLLIKLVLVKNPYSGRGRRLLTLFVRLRGLACERPMAHWCMRLHAVHASGDARSAAARTLSWLLALDALHVAVVRAPCCPAKPARACAPAAPPGAQRTMASDGTTLVEQ